MSEAAAPAHRSGYVAIAGRPNVGKSTLLNHLIGAKVSITSRKAQTTRHRILGVRSDADVQYVFLDTPGFQTRHRNALNRAMNRSITDAVSAADAVVMVIDATGWRADDSAVEALIPKDAAVIMALNKADLVKQQERMLEVIERARGLREFRAFVPISARTGKGLDALLAEICKCLPEAAPMYDADTLTDRPERFLAAELIREKIFRLSGEEIPYGTEVTIEQFVEEGSLRRIHATVLVDKAGHKAILLGAKGERMKRIATEARLDMEKLFGTKVYLEVWVKVKTGWADNAGMLKALGYQ
jgi:GTP-binding protein Era